jgi:hydrogenase expression/formation protein HypD
MKYVDEYRDGTLARGIAVRIAAEVRPNRSYRFMEFCGGHTHAISRYGIEDLLPAAIRMIHGPGCPVCVLPMGRVDAAIALARLPEVTLATYGDVMRVPGSHGASLLSAKAAGADVRMVYSTLDALRIAEQEPGRQVVFLAIGFETTTPPTAMALRRAREGRLRNFSIFCNHVLTPPAIAAILADERAGEAVALDGLVGPAHVSTVIGTAPYASIAERFRKPVVVAGFEPLDILQAILMLVSQCNDGRHDVENQYSRAVTPQGNVKAQADIAEMFQLRDSFEWRGLGSLPASALEIAPGYAEFDAERRFVIPAIVAPDNPACECGTILRGLKRPAECKLFGTACTPDTPIGACMVSSEGACAAHWSYGRFRERRPA